MSRCLSWTLAISLAVGAAACTPYPEVTSQTVTVAGVGPVEVERLNVRVVAVDRANRTVIVEQRGYRWLVEVPEVFGDLSNVREGDNVEIRRVDGAIASVRRNRRGAKPGITYTEAVSGPPFHNLPDKYVVRSVTLTAKFDKFDAANGVVNYVGPLGPRSHVVADPAIREDLRRLRRGDMVDLTFAEAFHIVIR